MPYEQTLSRIEELLRPYSVGASRHENRRVDIVVKREDLVAAVTTLNDARWGYLVTITGVDLPWPKPKASPKPAQGAQSAPKPAAEPTVEASAMEDKLEVLYHFAEGAVVGTLRVTVPYSDPRVPTICPVVPTATLYEREIAELFGIVVVDTPDTSRLVLPDDWPEGVYPLRKSFTGLNPVSKG